MKITQYNFLTPQITVRKIYQNHLSTKSGIASKITFAKYIEKSFEERIGSSYLPAIKFSGLIFLLLSIIPLSFLIKPLFRSFPYATTSTGSDHCTRLCVFRI